MNKKIINQVILDTLRIPGFRDSLEGTCESCGKDRRECYDNVVEEIERENREEALNENPPFRAHDYTQTQGFDTPFDEGSVSATPVQSVKDKLVGLKSDLNNALDEVEVLIETLG